MKQKISYLCTVVTLASSLAAYPLYAAEEDAAKAVQKNANGETITEINTDTFSKAFVDQIKALDAQQKQEKANFYQDMHKRYPDVVPERLSYPSLKFYNQIFDTSLVNSIFFAPGSSYLSDVQQTKLLDLVQAMSDAPELYLILEGHSGFNDQIEERDKRLFFNRWISGKRAVRVWNFLTQQSGIDPNRIAMFAYDSQKPLNGEESETEKALNRRVELRLTSQPIPLVSRSSAPDAPNIQ